MNVTIKGNEYKLGDVAGNEENFEVIGTLMAMGHGVDANLATLLPGARRVLEESITNGSGAEAAAQAMADLPLKLNRDSEFWKACSALVTEIVS